MKDKVNFDTEIEKNTKYVNHLYEFAVQVLHILNIMGS